MGRIRKHRQKEKMILNVTTEMSWTRVSSRSESRIPRSTYRVVPKKEFSDPHFLLLFFQNQPRNACPIDSFVLGAWCYTKTTCCIYRSSQLFHQLSSIFSFSFHSIAHIYYPFLIRFETTTEIANPRAHNSYKTPAPSWRQNQHHSKFTNQSIAERYPSLRRKKRDVQFHLSCLGGHRQPINE